LRRESEEFIELFEGKRIKEKGKIKDHGGRSVGTPGGGKSATAQQRRQSVGTPRCDTKRLPFEGKRKREGPSKSP